MAIQLASYLTPRTGGQYHILEDNYFRGGFRVVADEAARDAIFTSCLKSGMLCYVVATSTYYRYDASLETPAWVPATFLTKNAASEVANFPAASICPGSVMVDLATGLAHYSDGTNWVALAKTSQLSSIPYDIALNVYGQPNVANDLLATYVAVRQVQIAAGNSGVATCSVASSTSTTLPILLGTTQVGTVVFAGSAATGVVTFTSAVSMTVGQVLSLKNAASASTTIEDISVTLAGTVVA